MAVSSAKTNVLAIVSLVTSILGLSLVGIITGHIALSQITKTGEEGRGPAFAGLLGIVGSSGLYLHRGRSRRRGLRPSRTFTPSKCS